MRSLAMLMRLADDMRKITMSMPTPFFEDPWSLYRMTAFNPASRIRKEESLPRIGKNGYKVSMDVAQFKPDELNVKVVDNCVVVEGKYEDREDDNGYVSGSFVRRFALPQGFDPEKAISTLSSDGILTVKVPAPNSDNSNERVIPIQHTAGPAIEDSKDTSAKGTKSDD